MTSSIMQQSLKPKTKVFLFMGFLTNFACFLIKSILYINQKLLLDDLTTLLDNIFIFLAIPSSFLALLNVLFIVFFKPYRFLSLSLSIILFLIFPYIIKNFLFIFVNKILKEDFTFMVLESSFNKPYLFLFNSFFDFCITIIGLSHLFYFRIIQIQNLNKVYCLGLSFFNLAIHVFFVSISLYVCYVFAMLKDVEGKLKTFFLINTFIIYLFLFAFCFMFFRQIQIKFLSLLLFPLIAIIVLLCLLLIYKIKPKVKYLFLCKNIYLSFYYCLLIISMYFSILGFRLFVIISHNNK